MTDSGSATLHGLCHAAVRAFPDAPAVTYDDGHRQHTLTYAEVQAAADTVCTLLREAAGHSEVVAIAVEPSPLTPSVLLGILQVPAAFYSSDGVSLHHVVRRKHVRLLITDKHHKQELLTTLSLESTDHRVTCNFVGGLDLFVIELLTVESHKFSDPLAYIITTSGTTGTPKIVSVPHQCIVPNVQDLRSIFEATRDDIVFMASPLTFDPSIVEIFITLSRGARLLIVPYKMKMNPSDLLNMLVHRHRVTILQATPALLSQFGSSTLKEHLLNRRSSLRVLALGGEACPSTDVLRSWRCHGNQTRLFNLYGITEVSSWATVFEITEEFLKHDNEEVPLGAALSGTFIQILDDKKQEVSAGEGKIFIGGRERKCYLDDEQSSDDLSQPITYRDSGDLAYINSDGQIYYRGRKDRQIKRHGKRLNLQHLDKVLMQRADIERCVSVCEDACLYVFLAPRGGVDQDSEIRRLIRTTLPDQYTPTQILSLQTLPVTCHGKVDVKGLLKIVHDQRKPVATSVKLFIENQWRESLGLAAGHHIEESDNFLKCGGTSFGAVQFIEQLQRINICSSNSLLEIVLEKTFKDVVSCITEWQEPLLKHKSGNSSANNSYTPAVKKPRITTISNTFEREEIKLKDKISNCSKTLSISRGSKLIIHPCSCQTCGQLVKNLTESSSRWTNKMVLLNRVSVNKKMDGPKVKMKISENWKVNSGKCVDASPLIVCRSGADEPVVYIGSHSHVFMAIGLHSGRTLWQRHLGDRVESSACLSLCTAFVIIGCYDGKVYMLDAESGDVWWTYQTQGQVKSSPCVDLKTGYVFTGSHDRHLYAFDVKLRSCVWRVDLSSGSVFSSPSISYAPHQLYCVTLAGVMSALNPISGAILWQYDCGSPVFSSVCCLPEAVCVASVDGCIHCFNFSGNKLWSFKTDKPVFSSACAVTMTTSSQPMECIVIGSHDQNLYCLQTSDGSLLWKTKMKSPVYSTPCVMLYTNDIPGSYKDFDEICGLMTSENRSAGSGLDTDDATHLQVFKSKSSELSHPGQEFIESVLETPVIGLNGRKRTYSENNSESDTEQMTAGSTDGDTFPNKLKTTDIQDTEYSTVLLSQNDVQLENENQESEGCFQSKGYYIICCSTDGTMYVLNPADGVILTQCHFPGEVFSSPVTYGNRLILGCRDNNIICASLTQENSL